MIDLHSHLLPGIDDGAPDMAATVAMARAAVAGGVDQIVATSHVCSTYRNDPLTFPERVAAVQRALDDAGVPLLVHIGAELSHAVVPDLSEETLSACRLAGGAWLLLEAPLVGPAPFIDRLVTSLHERGYRVLLAHPERIPAFQRNVGVVEKLVEQGCLCSVTASSLSGRFGGTVKRFSAELLARGLVHNLASDAHDAERRSPALRPVLDQAVADTPELERWLGYLVEEVPAAILAGEVPAGTPPVIEQPRRGLLDRLRRR